MANSEISLKKISRNAYRVYLKNLNIGPKNYIRDNIKNIVLRKYFSGISDLMQLDTKRPFYELNDFKKLIKIKTFANHFDIQFNQNQEEILRSKYLKPNAPSNSIGEVEIDFRSLFFSKTMAESLNWMKSDGKLSKKYGINKKNIKGGMKNEKLYGQRISRNSGNNR